METCSPNLGLTSPLSSDSEDLKLALELLLAETMRSKGLSSPDSDDDELLDEEEVDELETRLST